MREKRIENISMCEVTLKYGDGGKLNLQPGESTVKCNIINLNEVKESVTVVYDLTEVVDG